MQAIERIRLPKPDTHCFDTDTDTDVWSYSPELVRETVLAHIDKLEAEVERLRKDAERKPITDEDTLALFNRIQTGMRFTDAAARPFAAGVAAAEFFHKIKGTS